jgi:hypothetical protein
MGSVLLVGAAFSHLRILRSISSLHNVAEQSPSSAASVIPPKAQVAAKFKSSFPVKINLYC